jgi:predicted dehydrogenase
VKVGFVGCGFVTRHRHLPTLLRRPEIEVTALADVDPGALSTVADQFRIEHRHNSVDSLVRDPDVEAVAVCVPVSRHAEVVLAALKAGKHVFVEKPLAHRLDEADHMLRQPETSSSRVLVGFNLRWHRNIQAARRIIDSGMLGPIQSLSTVFSDPLFARKNLPPWRSRRSEGGGVLFDKLAHHFDLWRFLLRDEAEAVFALSRSGRGDDDTVTINGRMMKGPLVTTIGMDDAFMRHEITVYGERGGVHVDCYRFDGLTEFKAGDVPGAPLTRLRHLAVTLRNSRANLAAIRRGGDFNASYDGEWRHFAELVRNGGQPSCGLADGRAALQIALAADRSRAIGQPVSISSDGTAVESIT